MTFGTAAVTIAIAVVYARFVVPRSRAVAGRIVHRKPLTLLAKLHAVRAPGLVVLALTLGGIAIGEVRPVVGAVGLVALGPLVLLPMRYTLTTVGIQLDRSRCRRWIEFAGVSRHPGGARLQGGAGAGGMTVWLAGSRDADETILLLRQLVRGSYKGEMGLGFGATVADEEPAEAVVRVGEADR